jgi:DNA-binding NarL/FixJ family response regulator
VSSEQIAVSEKLGSSEFRATLERPTVLLADDHGSVLERVTSLLEPIFEVVGRVADGAELISEAKRLRPDAIVLDIMMPVLTGIEAARELHETGSPAKLVFLTVHEDATFVRACFAAGGVAYVSKSRLRSHLIPALTEALAGHCYLALATSP